MTKAAIKRIAKTDKTKQSQTMTHEEMVTYLKDDSDMRIEYLRAPAKIQALMREYPPGYALYHNLPTNQNVFISSYCLNEKNKPTLLACSNESIDWLELFEVEPGNLQYLCLYTDKDLYTVAPTKVEAMVSNARSAVVHKAMMTLKSEVPETATPDERRAYIFGELKKQWFHITEEVMNKVVDQLLITPVEFDPHSITDQTFAAIFKCIKRVSTSLVKPNHQPH